MDLLRIRTRVFALPFLLLLITGCVTERSPVTGEERRYGFTWEQEQQIGKESDIQISRQLGVYDDPQVQAYVDDVAQRVLSSSDFRKADLPERYQQAEFTFRVLDSPIVNAFALPGGYVYVTRGLLAHVENEAQLAVVLGHEIGHVAARHSAQQALKQQWAQIGLMAGVIIGSQVLGGGAEDLFNLGGTAMQLLLNKYSREHEREADALGVRYAAAEGYDAAQGAGFFVTLDRKSQAAGAMVPSWQSTHPDPGEREKTIVSMSRELEQAYPMDVVNTDPFMQAIQGLIVGDNPRQGFMRGGTFFHPELEFQFNPPSNWVVQNETQVVIMGDPNRQALMAFQIAPKESATAAARELVESGQLQVVRQGGTRINGLPAYVVEGQAQTQQGNVAVINAFIEYNGNVYSLLGYTSAEAYQNYRPLIVNTMQSFRELSDRRMLDVQPHHLNVFRADRSARFRDFLPAELPPGLDAETIAIMNQVELDQRIEQGRWLKIPRN